MMAEVLSLSGVYLLAFQAGIAHERASRWRIGAEIAGASEEFRENARKHAETFESERAYLLAELDKRMKNP